MRKTTRKAALFLLAAIIIVSASSVAFAAQVALTSVGQSPDAMMAMVVLKNMKVETDFDALMQPEDLSGHKVLIAVVGGSSKGLGAAGINQEQERDRALALIDRARGSGVRILVMHVGGAGRRGTLSDMFIEAVVPLAERITIVRGGNLDGLFDRIKGENVPVTEVETIRAIDEPLKRDLSDWGVL
ncbi:MAG: DUF6305 family protein [Thermovirgaceae bacterium]|nr:DUF6305 family protein [Synergistales bacterium]MDI9392197.1 DUF6305 family protein [Synergistota bacterium]MDY0178569.1 DUF6305 family protein [Synergistaceae bacterium]HRW87853.1 DUF6305 family protein [Thermovirgaceae bacterium]MDD3829485.1 DUF6305 family protein [Synergistales bacterium]